MEKLLLKEREVLEILSISRSTLRRLADEGTIPRTRIGGAVRYKRTDINEFIQSLIEPD